MRLIAALLAALAAACVAGSAWLWRETRRFHQSADYAPNSPQQPGYTAGGVEADGGGIYFPSVLLLCMGVFLARFAWSLWRDERRRRRLEQDRRTRQPGQR